jgi:UDP-2,3-diacylglucosamine pyrophosphatase LpxH
VSQYRPRLNGQEYAAIMNYRQGKRFDPDAIQVEEPSRVPDWLNTMEDGREEVLPTLRIQGKTAVFSDIHLGIHDKAALIAAIQYAKQDRVENIILNGDILDAAQISGYPKHPDAPKFLNELEFTKQFLEGLRSEFKDQNIYFKIGNHEDRLERYLMQNADALAGLIDFRKLLKLDDLGIRFVESTQFMKVENTYIVHGHEMKVSGGVNPARALILKAAANVVMGHVHRTSFASIKSLDGKFYKAYTMGCLCKLRQAYMPHSNSNHGFAIIQENGMVDNLFIENGVVQ